jgi:alkaline phosphatase
MEGTRRERLITLSGTKSLLVYLAEALSLVLLTTACSAAVKHDERTPAVASGLQAPAEPQSAKHIILFIGDGMQLENEIATSRYLFARTWHFPTSACPTGATSRPGTSPLTITGLGNSACQLTTRL